MMVEDRDDDEFLISRAIKKEFPDAMLKSYRDAAEALSAAKSQRWDAFIVHRALDVGGIVVVKELRQAQPDAMIIMISGRNQTPEAIAAGADRFLGFDELQQLGPILAAEWKRRNEHQIFEQ